VRIFFSARRDPQEVLAELRLQRRMHQEKLAAYRRITEEVPHPGAKSAQTRKFWVSGNERGQGQIWG
jgi:hypothetical protein